MSGGRSRAAGGQSGAFGWIALALALAIGAAVRFWNLTAPSLHSDEAFTFAVSGLPIPALLHNLAVHDFHPPLFYVTTHYLMGWLRWPFWNYRYLTATFGLLTIVATWAAARRMFGVTAAAVAALLIAIQPALVEHDRLYRMYAVTVALSTLSWWLLIEAEEAAGRRRLGLWTTYAAVAIVLPYVDYLGAIMLLCQALYALTRLPKLGPALGFLALASLALIPWLGALRRQLPLGGLSLSKPALDMGLAHSIRGAFAPGAPDAWFAFPLADLVPAGALIVLIVTAAWLGRRSALPFWMAALVLQVAGSIALGKNLAYFPRYLLIDAPSVSIAFGLVVSALGAARVRLFAVVAALLAFWFYGVTVSNVLFSAYYQFPDWYAVNAFLLRNEQPDDAIILDEGYELLVVRNFTAFRDHKILSFMNPNDFGPILAWINRHPNERVWYVQHQNFYWDPTQRIATALLEKRRQLLSHNWARQSAVDDVSVALFDKVPMTKVR